MPEHVHTTYNDKKNYAANLCAWNIYKEIKPLSPQRRSKIDKLATTPQTIAVVVADRVLWCAARVFVRLCVCVVAWECSLRAEQAYFYPFLFYMNACLCITVKLKYVKQLSACTRVCFFPSPLQRSPHKHTVIPCCAKKNIGKRNRGRVGWSDTNST